MRCMAAAGPIPACIKDAKIQSVFEHSINIEIPGETCLITAHSFPDISLPGSFYVPELRTGDLAAGMKASWNTRQIRLGEQVIWFSDACRKESMQLYPDQKKPELFDTEICRRLLEEERRRSQIPEVVAVSIYDRLGQVFCDYFRALSARESQKGKDALKRCVGLGLGLTPSGDDMLCGILGFQYVYDASAFAWTAGLLEGELPRTNRISASYLGWALRGCASSLVRNVIYGLVSCDTKERQSYLVKNTRELLKVGHTSGADLLEGILLAAEQTMDNTGRYQMS